MRLRVFHRTEYLYSNPVSDSINELRLQPLNTRWQEAESSIISVIPACRLSSYEDLNYNQVHYFELPQPHSRLVIDSRSEVKTTTKVNFEEFPYGFLHQDLEACLEMEECVPFLQNSHHVEVTPEVWREAIDIQDDSEDVFQTAYQIMEYIYKNFTYSSGSTNVATHANEVIAMKQGVCQDFAHAMTAYCRALKIPARYVSGYFFDATRDQSLRGSEASHAWVDVYIDGHGWFAFDPTNNKVIDDTYIIVATGRDYRDVPPVQGSFYGIARSSMRVSVTIKRI